MIVTAGDRLIEDPTEEVTLTDLLLDKQNIVQAKTTSV